MNIIFPETVEVVCSPVSRITVAVVAEVGSWEVRTGELQDRLVGAGCILDPAAAMAGHSFDQLGSEAGETWWKQGR